MDHHGGGVGWGGTKISPGSLYPTSQAGAEGLPQIIQEVVDGENVVSTGRGQVKPTLEARQRFNC